MCRIPASKAAIEPISEFPETQRRLLKAMQETGKPVVLVLMSGSGLAVTWEAENLPAILQAWYPGQQGATRWQTSCLATATPQVACLSHSIGPWSRLATSMTTAWKARPIATSEGSPCIRLVMV